ncbi:MAG: proliferating cell nuclear antigen (pcna) [Nanoarchaeota archaeon]|nr:proliferating cell nuclear antigen (pcna) [Nanoarchaeota archaeon]
MKLTLAEPKYFKESISLISDLVNEARFKITPNAIELVAMDPANVAMVIFKLLSSSFTEYDVRDEVEMAINLNNLKQILRRVTPSDVVTLELGAENQLIIKLKAKTTRTFSLPLIDVDEKEQRIPQLSFPASVTTKASTLTAAIEDADIVAESVLFVIENDRFKIQAEGDLSKASIEISQDEETTIKNHSDETIKAKYSIEYLKKMIGGSKLAENVVIQFSKDYPLKLEYTTINKVQLVYILAPRVEND